MNTKKIIYSLMLTAAILTIVACGNDKGVKLSSFGKTYTINIGEIGKTEDGLTFVKIYGKGINNKLLLDNETIPIMVKIEVENRTLRSQLYTSTNKDCKYIFETDKMPDRIIVCSNDGSSGEVTFDAKTKAVIE